MTKLLKMFRGKNLDTDDVYELPEYISDLYLDAKEQRSLAESIREGIKECRGNKVSWDEIAVLVSLPMEEVYRIYHENEDPIVVVRKNREGG